MTPADHAAAATGPPPRVSIIIPCRNEAGSIETCLRALLDQEGLPGGGWAEIIVADGMSDDGTRERVEAVVAEDPRVRRIDNPGRIVSTGLNAAVRSARGEIVVRADAHTEYAPDYVLRCVETLGRTGADVVGGAWQARGAGRIQGAIAAAFRSPFACGGGRAHDPDYEGALDTVYLGCWRLDRLRDLGLFDEDLVRNQDDEMNLRIRRAGGTVWQSPRIRSWYRPRSSLSALFRQYLQYGYWKVRVIRKHGRPASARHLVPVLFVIGLLLGWIPALIHPWFGVAYIGAISAYGILSLAASIRCARGDRSVLPLLPAVFLIYHLGYGLGFALGWIDFAILVRVPRGAMAALTRSTPPTTPDPAGGPTS